MQLEATGKSVEIAIQNGLLECGMKREDVEVKVVVSPLSISILFLSKVIPSTSGSSIVTLISFVTPLAVVSVIVASPGPTAVTVILFAVTDLELPVPDAFASAPGYMLPPSLPIWS